MSRWSWAWPLHRGFWGSRRVFTNMFRMRTDHERQRRKNIEWRYSPGMRHTMWQQRNR